MTTECTASLAPQVQGTRHWQPVFTVVDGDGDTIDTESATWTGQIRQLGGAWRDVQGTLTPLSEGRLQWSVSDADDMADGVLTHEVQMEIQLRGSYSGALAYTVTGIFTLCPGGW